MAINTGCQNSETCRLTLDQERLFQRLERLPQAAIEKGVRAMSLKELKADLAAITEDQPEVKQGGLSGAVKNYMKARFRNVDICRKTGLRSSTVSQWWIGKCTLQSNNFDLICDALGVKPFLPVHEEIDGFVTLASLTDVKGLEEARQEHDALVKRVAELEAENQALIQALTNAAKVLKTFQDEILTTLETEAVNERNIA